MTLSTANRRWLMVFGVIVIAMAVALGWWVQSSGEEEHWRRVAAQIHPKMTRAEVEKLLPNQRVSDLTKAIHAARSLLTTNGSDGTWLLGPPTVVTDGRVQVTIYEVSDACRVPVKYDISGATFSSNGQLLTFSSNNLVVEIPQVIRVPPMKP